MNNPTPRGDVTEAMIDDAHVKTARLQRELDISNADHVALWIEPNTIPDEPMSQCTSWLACRIVDAHEAAMRATEPKPGGYAYFNEDTGMEWSRTHPVESGEVPDATEIEAMTLDEFHRRWPTEPKPDAPRPTGDVEAAVQGALDMALHNFQKTDETHGFLVEGTALVVAALATLQAASPRPTGDVAELLRRARDKIDDLEGTFGIVDDAPTTLTDEIEDALAALQAADPHHTALLAKLNDAESRVGDERALAQSFGEQLDFANSQIVRHAALVEQGHWYKHHTKQIARWRDNGMLAEDGLDVMRDMMRTISHLAKLTTALNKAGGGV